MSDFCYRAFIRNSVIAFSVCDIGSKNCIFTALILYNQYCSGIKADKDFIVSRHFCQSGLVFLVNHLSIC